MTTPTTTPLWRAEFGAAYAVPDLIALDPEVLDLSWHNDAMPSFCRLQDGDVEPLRLRLWVDHVDPAARENGPEWPRFAVVREPASGLATDQSEVLYEGEDAAAALAALKTHTNDPHTHEEPAQ